MEINYQLFESENLFVQKFTGIFSFEKYQTYTRYITERIATKSIKKVLVDFRELFFDEKPDDFNQNLQRVVEFRKNINETELKNKDISLVFLVNKPMPTVIAHLFSANFSNYNYCSTEEIAIKTLMLPEHLNNLDSIINNLENTFDNR
jgi:hypothetical protein